jgi:hypothetical protein
MKIVLGVDFSDNCKRAVDTVLQLVRVTRTQQCITVMGRIRTDGLKFCVPPGEARQRYR